MDENDFLELCTKEGYSHLDFSHFKEAVEFAKNYLASKKRLSGDSYFDHNLRVGSILVQNHSTPEVVIAGLLHGILQYTSEEKIGSYFGSEVLHLVKGEEEIKYIKERNHSLEAEALRKILLTTLKDVRVIIIKLANKVDNLRTIEALPRETQQRAAQEALEIYAPLAYRLGMEKIKKELEDLSLKILYPEEYEHIATFLEESSEERENDIKDAIKQIKELTSGQVEILKIKGRSKHIYSIYKKITERKVKLEDQYDIRGVRVIVPEIKDCYALLGLLHEKFEPVEGRLKDYITKPKANFYRSIHTGIQMPNGKIMEIQIRTTEMDEFAEEGIAAHWRYKGVKSDQLFEKRIAWLRGILDLQKDLEHKEFLESAKVDVFGDEIYCYTPKGEVKELPAGATMLDFAYVVHEEIGNHAIGGRVNGKFVSLKQELKTGDVIEIITNKTQRPRRGWIKFVKSSRAKQKIRKSLREYEKLADFIYRTFKPLIKEEMGILVEAPKFPTAACMLAKCCCPLPGEEIIGIPTKRRIISTHKKICHAAEKEEERWINVEWKDSFNQKIRFFVQAAERSGLLADLLHTIAKAGFEVKEAKAKLLNSEQAECSFLVAPRELEILKELVKRVQKVKGVTRIYFE